MEKISKLNSTQKIKPEHIDEAEEKQPLVQVKLRNMSESSVGINLPCYIYIKQWLIVDEYFALIYSVVFGCSDIDGS